jgi:hypothetical protein
MDEVVHMRLEGTMADLLVTISPTTYGQHTIIERGKTVLYVLIAKAMYGTLKAALLFWEHLSSKLMLWGFEVNPYDRCVANKMIEGTQCTVVWHIDDLKISHVNKDVVTDIIGLLQNVYGKLTPLTENRGTVHDYLGMRLDFSLPGKVVFTMEGYINDILSAAPPDMDGESPTPAASHLFDVNMESPVKLDPNRVKTFHHKVAQLLFLSKRARPDIQTAVAFLCTRVKSPDVDDWKKLARVLKYLRGTVTMPLTLEASNLQVIKWWVDASYAVHDDMKSHTGGVMTMGNGVVYATSTRQKLNTRSSTEAELVSIHNVLPQVIWTRYFLQSQGYEGVESVVYQDNQSSILLEKNGKLSSGKRTRHINIRYFFVADRIKAKEVVVEYCPTWDMLAEFFTKPLQGKAFKNFRDTIMNINQQPGFAHRSVLGNEVQKQNVSASRPSLYIRSAHHQ